MTKKEYNRAYYKTHKEQFRQNAQNRRDALRMCHRCTVCGQQDAFTLNGRGRCAECVEKDTVYQRERRGYRPLWERETRPKPEVNWPRGSNKICYICNKRPNLEGKRLCHDCYEMSVSFLQKAWGRRRGTSA